MPPCVARSGMRLNGVEYAQLTGDLPDQTPSEFACAACAARSALRTLSFAITAVELCHGTAVEPAGPIIPINDWHIPMF